MSKLEKIKEQIGWLKVIFGLLFATDISLMAFLFNKFAKLSVLQLLLAILGPIFVIFMEKIDSLEDL